MARSSDDIFDPEGDNTASRQTMRNGGRSANSRNRPYDPLDSNQPRERTQPVMPGQTGYINQRRPVVRPSANFAPKPSARDANLDYRRTGERPSGGTMRPAVESLLSGIRGRSANNPYEANAPMRASSSADQVSPSTPRSTRGSSKPGRSVARPSNRGPGGKMQPEARKEEKRVKDRTGGGGRRSEENTGRINRY